MTRLQKLLQLAATTPDDPFTHYGVGLEYAQLERWDDALHAFDQALRVDAGYIAAYHQKARAALKLGQRDAATDALCAGIAAARARGERHEADEMQKMLEALA